MKKRTLTFLCILLIHLLVAQNNKALFDVRYYVKQGHVLFRIGPTDKAAFELIKNASLSIKRQTLVNGVFSNEVLIKKNLLPYSIADSSNWLKLFRKDKNKAAFVYQTVYNNRSTTNASNKTKNEKMLFDLLMLSCDLDKDIASACGLFFADTTVNNTKQYNYIFSINTSSSTAKELLTLKLNAAELSTDAPLTKLSAQFKNQTAQLKWQAKPLQGSYSGYYIERSTDSIHFERVHTAPLILVTSQFEKTKTEIFHTDTMPLSNTPYYYRVKGINFFGEESKSSNTVKGYCYKEVKTTPVIDSIKVIGNSSIRLHWQMEDKNENSLPDHYLVLRSNKDKGKYERIAKLKSAFTYNDNTPFTSNYYKIAAITLSNDTLYSFTRMAAIIDTIAPAPPKKLKAVVDKKGNVQLNWSKNMEADLQGYKLFKANALTEEFVQINERFIADTNYTFKLNLKTLSKKMYFKIAASDNNYNTSLLSEAIAVTRPDTIPPSAPLIINTSCVKNNIQLVVIKSLSDDVKHHTLWRRLDASTKFNTVTTIACNDTSKTITDSTAILGSGYYYQLSATDSSGNTSYSNLVFFKNENGYRSKITSFNSVVSRDKRSINLQWSYDQKAIEKFIIYRKKDTEPLGILKTISGNQLNYEDKSANIGNIYEYRIKAVMVNGTESVISDKLVVEF
jgi:hypothetical protein